MIVWEPKSGETNAACESETDSSADVLYQFAVAFPSWAGVMMFLYAIYLAKFGAFKMRLR